MQLNGIWNISLFVWGSGQTANGHFRLILPISTYSCPCYPQVWAQVARRWEELCFVAIHSSLLIWRSFHIICNGFFLVIFCFAFLFLYIFWINICTISHRFVPEVFFDPHLWYISLSVYWFFSINCALLSHYQSVCFMSFGWELRSILQSCFHFDVKYDISYQVLRKTSEQLVRCSFSSPWSSSFLLKAEVKHLKMENVTVFDNPLPA